MKQIDGMLEEACFFGTHHSMYDCPSQNKEECDLCWDDSYERDIKEGAASFYGSLWKDTFDALNMQPIVKKRKHDDEEDEVNEAEDEAEEEE